MCTKKIHFLKKINLFIYLWLGWVFVAAHGLSLIAVSRGYSSLRCTGFSLWWLLLLQSKGSRHAGFSSCGTWAQQLWLAGSRVQAQQLWCTGLVAPWHVGSSWTRAWTVSLALAGRFLTTAPPGKPENTLSRSNKGQLYKKELYTHTHTHLLFLQVLIKTPQQLLQTVDHYREQTDPPSTLTPSIKPWN